MKTRLLKKHPLNYVESHKLWIVRFDIAVVGYKTREEAQETRLKYIIDRYGK